MEKTAETKKLILNHAIGPEGVKVEIAIGASCMLFSSLVSAPPCSSRSSASSGGL